MIELVDGLHLLQHDNCAHSCAVAYERSAAAGASVMGAAAGGKLVKAYLRCAGLWAAFLQSCSIESRSSRARTTSTS